MNNNTKFIVVVNKLNKLIADLNIEISKDSENEKLKEKLEQILDDKERLYRGDLKDFQEIMIKYGEKNNE